MKREKKTEPVSPVRWLAVEIFYYVMEKGAYANIALDQALERSDLKLQERHQVTELVNGTVRMVKRLDGVLNLFLAHKVEQQNPWLKSILRLSLYQLLYMDQIPDYACVNDAVVITRRKTNDRLAAVTNGVLRNIIRQRHEGNLPLQSRLEYLSWQYSLPEWITAIYLQQSTDPNAIATTLDYLNRRPLVTLRANQLLMSRDDLVIELRRQGTDCDASLNTPWGIKINFWTQSVRGNWLYESGYFYIQDEGSMLAASILNPQPGELVYDLGAGLGGKTTHLAQLMHNEGNIKAWELYPQKVKLLQENCQRMGINMVETYTEDVLTLPQIEPAKRVLLDAPCSGLGVLHRRADLRWKIETQRLSGLVQLQYNLLSKAAQMVEPGGYLLYSTCTINRDENEGVIERFLQTDNAYVLTGFSQALSFFPLTEEDVKKAELGMLTIWPGKYQTDGMFYALLRREKV